jgi:hypothetical protein
VGFFISRCGPAQTGLHATRVLGMFTTVIVNFAGF